MAIQPSSSRRMFANPLVPTAGSMPKLPHPRALLEMNVRANGSVLHVRVMGKLTEADYERFVPEIERVIMQGDSLRMLIELHDFKGWTAGALWDDIEFNMQYLNCVDRLAIVGDSKWQKGVAIFCMPFTHADVRYFGHGTLTEAKSWVFEGLNWF